MLSWILETEAQMSSYLKITAMYSALLVSAVASQACAMAQQLSQE
jgi:hypothetical protein